MIRFASLPGILTLAALFLSPCAANAQQAGSKANATGGRTSVPREILDQLEAHPDLVYADFSSTIQAAVPMGAQTNFRSHFGNIKRTPPPKPGEKPNIWVQFLDSTPEENPERWDLASPITHLDTSDPPMHFISGELDKESTHAGVFRNRMREFGIAEGVTIIDGAPHAFPGRQKFFDQMLEAAAEWFGEHLK